MHHRGRDIVFYDGHCGLCHRAVRFLLPRDWGGSRFAFAPLQGLTLAEKVSAETRETLPDSIIVLRPDGTLLAKSEATRHLLRRLGGGWRLIAGLMGLVPRPIRDWGYDRVAAVRHRIFTQPDEACPLVPAGLRDRFLP
jgi:predicted DCC family thiol-disulfide oxidoreductase YuxK